MPTGVLVKPQVNITNTVQMLQLGADSVDLKYVLIQGKMHLFHSTDDVLMSYNRMSSMSTLRGE